MLHAGILTAGLRAGAHGATIACMMLAAVLLALFPAAHIALLGYTAQVAVDDVAPSRNQRDHLAILVTAWADRLCTNSESLEKADVERALRKALYNQVSRRAEARFEETLVALLMEDLGLRTSRGKREVERELVGPWRAAAIADSGNVLDRQGFQRQHYLVLTHREETLEQLRALHDLAGLDDDQEKALKTCAELYARRMIAITEEPGEKKRMIELCEEALVTRDTELALKGVRKKARGLLRRRASDAADVKSDDDVLALGDVIDEQMPQAFPDTFWHELAFDHARALERPDEHRKVLKDLIRGKPRPEDATPPPLEGR